MCLLLKKVKLFFQPILYLLIMIILFFYFPLSLHADTDSSYFHKDKVQKISILTEKDLIAIWLEQQPALKVHNYYVENGQQIIDLMKQRHNIDVSIGDIRFSWPSYNAPNQSCFKYHLKEPEKGLIGVYIKERKNPFQKTYPLEYKKYTLNDLTKFYLEIEHIYCFWDINTILPDRHQCKIHYINALIDTRKTSATEFISNYLYDKHITSEKILVHKNCYNILPQRGLIMPLPSCFIKQDIAGIYYDNGGKYIKLNNENDFYCIAEYANDSKNAYVFRIEEYRTQEVKKITLQASFNPDQAVKEWQSKQFFSLEYQDDYIEQNDYYVISKTFTLWDKKQNDFYVITVPQLHFFSWFYPEDMKNHINRNKINVMIINFIEENNLYHKLDKYNFQYKSRSFQLLERTDDMNNLYVQFELQNLYSSYKFAVVLKLDKCKTYDKLKALYEQKLAKWKSDCCFQPGREYNGLDIYQIITTRIKYLYTDGFNKVYNFSYDKEYYPCYDEDYECYKLKVDWNVIKDSDSIFDIIINVVKSSTNLYIDGIYFQDDKDCPVRLWRDVKFDGFFSLCPPPLKPLLTDI